MEPVLSADATTYTLLLTATLTGVLHTLIPDHWLPFVLIGRARGWSARTTAAVSGFSALVHAALSVLLGLVALVIGVRSAALVGETVGRVGAVLLVLFGLAYAAWAWRKRGHFHPGGSLLHRRETASACDGSEGPAHPEHLHYHADEDLIRGRAGVGAVSLALIVGANPCVLLLPMVLATAEQGARSVALVALAYSVPTFVLVIGLSVLGVAGSRRIRLPAPARYMEAASGLLIATTGLVFWVIEG